MSITTRHISSTIKVFKDETFKNLDSEKQILCKDKADFELRNIERNLRTSSHKKISTLSQTKKIVLKVILTKTKSTLSETIKKDRNKLDANGH
jgi:hypothetical protein